MFKYDVNEQLKAREIAKQSFPNYFLNLTGICLSSYNYSIFQSEYKTYLEAYFNDEFDKEKRDFIKEGYNYLNSLYLRNNQIFNKETVAAIFNRLWKQYTQLEKQIATYRFDAKVENSKGTIQNQINEQILDQLSLFNPLIYNICLTLNEKMKNQELTKEFNRQLMNKLNNLFNELNDVQNKLLCAEDDYYEHLNRCVMLDVVSDEKLDNSSRDWRKIRNEACHTMLKFVCEMVEFDIATYYNTFDYKNEQHGLDEYTIQKINYFNQCLTYLKHSNNYFCYLDKEDKQEIAIQKVLRRK